MKTKTCVVCGKEFIPNAGSQKICGNLECLKKRRQEYAKNNAEKYKENRKKYRQQPHVKAHNAEYDRQYQINNKRKIQRYKQKWYQKKRFLENLDKGILLKNTYWRSLTKEDRQTILDKLSK